MAPKKNESSTSQEEQELYDTSEDYDTASSSTQDDDRLNEIAYSQVDPKLPVTSAFCYRKDELNDLKEKKLEEIVQKQKEYIESFKDNAMIFFRTHRCPDKGEIEKFILQEKGIINSLPISSVIGYFIGQMSQKIQNLPTAEPISKENISKFIHEVLEEDNKDEEDSLDARNTTEATIQAYEEYFKQSYEYLTKNGMVYVLPEGKHKWSYNIHWLLGHFCKGTDIFIIKSEINEESKLRGKTSKSSGDLGSGFFREIAICAYLGYKLQIDQQNNIVLKHDNPSILQQKSKEEILKEIMSLSIADMVPYYNKIMEDYKSAIQHLRLKSCENEYNSERTNEQASSSSNKSDDDMPPPQKKPKVEKDATKSEEQNYPKSQSSSAISQSKP